VRIALIGSLLLAAGTACADQAIETPQAFLDEAFGAPPATPQTLWLDDKTQAQLRPIFGHPYPQARLHYWRIGKRSAWILDEVGKEFPITAGFVVDGAQLEMARVLTYREARGDEIRYPAFLKQFKGVHQEGERLQPQIDGISGATLSVAAMQRMARAALTLASSLPAAAQ